MKPDESSFPRALTDSDLDRLLEATNKDLLARIEAAADPTSTLTVIMTRTAQADRQRKRKARSQQTRENWRVRFRQYLAGRQRHMTGRDIHQAPVAAVIGVRSNACSLVGYLARDLELARTLNPARDFTVARDLARELARDLARAYALARDLELALDRNLARDRALARARDLARDFAPDLGSAYALARDFPRILVMPYFTRHLELADALALARDLACELARELGTHQVDASGADLSGVAIEGLDALDGVIWTSQTTWPSGIADQVLVYSRELQPGVYQVGRGNDPDRFTMTSM